MAQAVVEQFGNSTGNRRLAENTGTSEALTKVRARAAEALIEGRCTEAIELLSFGLENLAPDNTVLWQLHRDLARAFDRIGDINKAAEHYALAAKAPAAKAPAGRSSAPEASIERRESLRRLAADRYLIHGNKEQGMALLQPLIERFGFESLIAPQSALALRVRLGLTKLQIGGWLTFRKSARPGLAEIDTSSKAVLKIDVCWTLCRGLRTVTPGLGSALSSEHLLLALRCGEPYRLSRALALEIGYQAYGGWSHRTRVERLSRRALSLARQLPQKNAMALAEIMTGEALILLGQWRRALSAIDRGMQILETECPESWWERRRGFFLQLRCLAQIGTLTEVGHILHSARDVSTDDHRPGHSGDVLENRFHWMVELAEDRPRRALKALESIRESPSSSYWLLFAHTEVATYRGDVYRAWHHLDEHWSEIVVPKLSQIQFLAIEAWHLRARTALSALISRPEGADAPALTLAVRTAIDALERIDSPWAEALTLLVKAGLKTLLRRRYEALELLQKAETRLDSLDLALYTQTAKWQRSRLKPSAVAPERAKRAEHRMAELGVVNPQRMADLLIPGQWQLDELRDAPTRPR